MINKIIRILMVLIISSLCFSACDGGLDVGENSQVGLVTPKSELKQVGGDVFIEVQASQTWSLDLVFSDDDWAVLSVTSGEGNKSNIILSYDENTAIEARELKIVLRSQGKLIENIVKQAGTSGSGGSQQNPDGDELTNWMELPATFDNDDRRFYYHLMEKNGKSIRNYSFDWDPKSRLSLWVAYPLNSSLIGDGSRSDDWGYDPKVPYSEQPVLYGGYKGGYDRGHQLPSADRYYTKTANKQTFYFTNVTPQKGSFNQRIWAKVEGDVRSWAYNSDTLYVVTGCVIDGSTSYATDNNGNKCVVPVGYYKAVLRYDRASTIGVGGYSAMAIYFDHETYDTNTSLKNLSMSINDLEEKIGLDLFVNLPGKLGEANANKVENENPQGVNWWW